MDPGGNEKDSKARGLRMDEFFAGAERAEPELQGERIRIVATFSLLASPANDGSARSGPLYFCNACQPVLH